MGRGSNSIHLLRPCPLQELELEDNAAKKRPKKKAKKKAKKAPTPIPYLWAQPHLVQMQHCCAPINQAGRQATAPRKCVSSATQAPAPALVPNSGIMFLQWCPLTTSFGAVASPNPLVGRHSCNTGGGGGGMPSLDGAQTGKKGPNEPEQRP